MFIILDLLLDVIILLFLPFKGIDWKSTRHNKTPIFLVHGYLHAPYVFLFYLYRFGKKGLGPIYSVNLGNPFCSIEEQAIKLKGKVHRYAPDKKVILIGHSMGGLVASHFAFSHPTDVKAVMTIGSPLHGTKVAKLGIGKAARQMETGSLFTEKLREKIAKEKKILFYHIASKKDEIIRPYTAALMQIYKEREYTFENVGHISQLFHRSVVEKLTEWLEQFEDTSKEETIS